ncbi:MAG: OmpA family protein [Candidatus Thiodiazotropha sp.]
MRRPLRRFAAALICLLGLGQAVGADRPDAEIYMAQVHDSTWTFQGSGPVCELTHEIPQFGLARFLRVAGENLVFRIDSYQPVPERVEATLREVSPEWHHSPPDPLEQQVVVASGRHPISLDRRPAGWLLSSLAKGQIGSFDLLDWNDSRKPLHIRLSPVKFQQPYREFKQCISRLAGKGYESLRHTTIHFDTDVHRLDPASRRTLEGLADYVKTVGGIKAVKVSGFADDRGKSGYNLRLSARRAKSVADFLVARGIAPSLVTSRHYGESRPKVRGHSKAARAANRRVEIDLTR